MSLFWMLVVWLSQFCTNEMTNTKKTRQITTNWWLNLWKIAFRRRQRRCVMLDNKLFSCFYQLVWRYWVHIIIIVFCLSPLMAKFRKYLRKQNHFLLYKNKTNEQKKKQKLKLNEMLFTFQIIIRQITPESAYAVHYKCSTHTLCKK